MLSGVNAVTFFPWSSALIHVVLVAFMAGRAILALCLFSLSHSQPLKLFDCSGGRTQCLNQQILKASFRQVPKAEL